MSLDIFEMRVSRVIDETGGVKSFELRMPDGGPVPAFTAGAHIDVHMDGFARQYSMCNDPAETHRYVFGVLRENESRGGSIWVHDRLEEGARLKISGPRNNFPLTEGARHHVLVAGGIGVTPILCMAWKLAGQNASFEMHYCAKSRSDAAFADTLDRSPITGNLTWHFDGGDPAKGFDLKAAFADVKPDTHIYCCGPAGMIAAAKAATAHWPQGTFHFESFAAAEAPETVAPARGFEVEIASSGAVFQVPEDKSIAAVLRENGVEVDTLCEDGICGTCITAVLEGEPDHRDSVLDNAEKAAGKLITVCCSRAKSARLKLDL
ncbi:MAG: PDR/VanB family oxidoreductase [Rhodospirillales bacterium]